MFYCYSACFADKPQNTSQVFELWTLVFLLLCELLWVTVWLGLETPWNKPLETVFSFVSLSSCDTR